MATSIELLDTLLTEIDNLQFNDDTGRDALKKRVRMYLKRIMGEDSEYAKEVSNITFYPMYAPSTESDQHSAWEQGSGRLRNLVNTVKEELKLFGDSSARGDETAARSPSIFIVHGHDEELKQSVARTVEKLGLAAVILHEQPNRGRTIIEKFDEHSNVSFAVVLLSADDIARGRKNSEEVFRARQNVIFELGFFLGRLGRQYVAAIYKPHERFELPSDYSGVLFIEYDSEGAWRYKLAKELKACGFTISVEAIL